MPEQFNERPMEYAFCLKHLNRKGIMWVLDVGPGNCSWPALLSHCGYRVTAIDEMNEYHGKKIRNPWFSVVNDDITNPQKLDPPFDAITCISTLEHIAKPWRAVKNMCGLLRGGGILLMTFPFSKNGYVRNAYDLPGSYGKDRRYRCGVFSTEIVFSWAKRLSMEIIDTERWRVFDGDYWSCGERLEEYRRTTVGICHLACVAMEKIKIQEKELCIYE